MTRRKKGNVPTVSKGRRKLAGARSLDAQLQTLESSGLIYRAQQFPELEYLFRHVLVQDAAYSSLLRQQRRTLHELIGNTLEQLYSERWDEVVPVLAHHFFEAEDHPRALRYYMRAGDLATGKYALGEAQMDYERALAIVKADGALAKREDLQHLILALGRVLEMRGNYAGAREHYLAMESYAQAQADRPLELAALIALGTIYSAPTDVFNGAEAEALAERSMALARDLGDRAAEAKVLWNLALLSKFRGGLSQSLAYGEQAAAIARELDLRDTLAHILNDILVGYLATGDPNRARLILAEAGTIWREQRNLAMLVDNLTSSADLELSTGNYGRAQAIADEAYRLSCSIGNVWNQSYSKLILGQLSLERGELDKAFAELDSSLTLGAEAGFTLGQVAAYGMRGLIFAYLGDCARALEESRQSHLITQKQFGGWIAIPVAMAALSNTWCGDLTEAQVHVKAAYTDLTEGDLQSETFVLIADGELSNQQGDYAHALVVSDKLVTTLTTIRVGYFLDWALFEKGEALFGLKRMEEARDAFLAATAQQDARGGRFQSWRIFAKLADIEVQDSNIIEALRWRTRARENIDFTAAHAPSPELRASFLARPDVRAILESA